MENKATFINFSVWNACNLRCNFCYNDSWRDYKQFFEEIELLKEKLLSYKFKWQKKINLIWGEPLAYPKLFELLDFLIANGFTMRIVTNWMKFWDKKFMDKILNYKNIIKSINFSLHSHTSELEEKITDRKWTFEKKILWINALKENNMPFFISLVINNYNVDHIFDIIEHSKKNFNDIVTIQWMITESYFSSKNILSIPSYTKIIEQISKLVNHNILIRRIHWIPLCIHYKIQNVNYWIRELNREFLYSFRDDWVNLLKSKLEHNYVWDKCKKCYAFWKFCFWPWKLYVKKFWYNEFTSLTKLDTIKLIKQSNASGENK
jgi:MoaA/NifB/PqqE/SkfB family radical SAM enzyme